MVARWLLHKLFGWKYVVLVSPVMDNRYTRRGYRTSGGLPYVCLTSDTIWFLLDDGKVDNHYRWVSLY